MLILQHEVVHADTTLKNLIVVVIGIHPSITSISAKQRKYGVSINISFINESQSMNHCCSKWFRSITSNGIGEQHPLLDGL